VRPGTHWRPAQGEATVTLLLRHGQTPMSVQKRYAGRSDAPLTDVGVQQAAAAAKRLASASLGVIVTSPLLRTVQTAQEVAAVTGAAVVTDDGFRETDFGAWEGLTFAEVRERWPAELAAWLADPAVAPPGGESFTEVSARVTAALHRVLAAREGQTVLIVSHDHADQDAGRRGAAGPAGRPVPDAPGCRGAVPDRLVRRRACRAPVVQ